MTSILLLATLTALGPLMLPVQACLELTENARPVLFCQTSVSQLPLKSDSIPAQIAKVRILGTSIKGQHDGRLGQVNLTGLETLTYLEISNFNLEVILADTFRAMQQLRVLDLSRNRIITIQAGAFSGLKVDLLSLTDNAGLSLVRGVFRGAEVRNLAARNCGLREVDYATIAEAKPRQLGLSHNQLTTLDLRFEKLVKPWASPSQMAFADVDDWGFIDLTNNPLHCDCQLVWLPKVLEEQLYAAQRSISKLGYDKPKDPIRVSAGFEATNEVPVKRMYQLNLTCASPANLANKPLPQSWNFYCPKPKIVGIVVNLLTSQADHAQLTCIGQGQPPPRLAWTYRLNGHKVQKTLDSPAIHPFVGSGDETRLGPQYYDYMPQLSGPPDMNVMHTRSIALNVSLRDTIAKNFTCTVWNEDSLKEANENHPFDLIDRLKMGGLDQEHLEAIQSSRMHEVTVRVVGPPRSPLDSPLPLQTPTTRETNEPAKTNGTISGVLVTTTEIVLTAGTSGPYDYLFTERFSLLQLLGAVFGTFIVTLALLYTVTHFLSCFCHFPTFPVHKLSTKQVGEKVAKKRLFPSLRPRGMALFSSTHGTPERAPLSDNSLGNTFNCDSAFSLLTSGTTNNFNLSQGPATVSVRKQAIPPALLLTSVPTPPGDRGSATPPPNPAYWSMPEYTYTGSHEYDVPRPLEPLVSSHSLARPNHTDLQLPNSSAMPSFLSLNKPNNVSGINTAQLLDPGYNRNAFAFHNGSTLPPLLGQWSQQQQQQHTSNEMSALNTLFSLSQMGNHPPNGMASMLERQLPCVNYTPYPPSNSAVYGADYPAYLQTRPYPHHQIKSQPLLQFMTQPNQQLTGVMMVNGGKDQMDQYPQPTDSNRTAADQSAGKRSAPDDQSP